MKKEEPYSLFARRGYGAGHLVDSVAKSAADEESTSSTSCLAHVDVKGHRHSKDNNLKATHVQADYYVYIYNLLLIRQLHTEKRIAIMKEVGVYINPMDG